MITLSLRVLIRPVPVQVPQVNSCTRMLLGNFIQRFHKRTKDNKKQATIATMKAKSNIPSSRHVRKEKSTRRSHVGPLIHHSELRKKDILLGRGISRFKHPGNIAYRALIDSRLGCYLKGDRTVKSRVVLDIINELKRNNCRFLQKHKDGEWQEVDFGVAREKVGHSIRDTFKMEGRFGFQDKKFQIFDQNATFGRIFDYITENYAMIALELSQGGGGLTDTRNLTWPGKHVSKCAFAEEEDSVPETISEKDDDSSMSVGSVSDANDRDLTQDDSRHQVHHKKTATPMLSSTRRECFVQNYISKLNEEVKRFEQLDNLDFQRDTTMNFFLTSMASIEDWVDLNTSCSERPDDDWSKYLQGLTGLSL